ncbi:MAG: acyltransferase family protein, partial [Kangiellaceae bacterium]|nr:acyltransferase family protein [Kangiellaceae bacterium]
MSDQNIRYHSIDFLRAGAMLLGIIYHVANSFHTEAHKWIVKDITANSFVDAFLVYSHIFRMPLFFIIAGFFCALVIRRKGKGAMIKNRLKRIGLPFLIFGILFIPAWMALVYYSYIYVEPRTEFVAAIMQGANSNQPPSLLELPIGHLWFLYYLLFFYLIYALVQPALDKVFEKL